MRKAAGVHVCSSTGQLLSSGNGKLICAKLLVWKVVAAHALNCSQAVLSSGMFGCL